MLVPRRTGEPGMVQRVRASLASRPNTLAVVAVVLFVAILILTGRWLNRGGGGRLPAASSAATGTAGTQAPARIGTRTKCPPRWPVLAASNHTSYPPGHPGKPPAGVTAVACYQTAIQAASAGYAPAPPPAGVLEVGGVYLVPTSASFRAHCRQVADRLEFAVPCPGLLPTLAPGVRSPRPCEELPACQRGRFLRFQWDGFQVPPGYRGPSDYGTLDVVAGPTPGGAGQLLPPGSDARPVATLTVHQTRAVLATCPEEGQQSSWGGRVLLRWSQRGHPDGGRRLRLERGQPAAGGCGGRAPATCQTRNLIP
jgi:hypothetical protein